MLNRSYNRIKIYFLILSGLIVLTLFTAIVTLHNNPYFTATYLKSYITDWKYKLEFSQFKGKAFASSALGPASGEAGASSDNSAVSIPVLVYHGVLPKSDGSDINVTEDQFKNQMFALEQAGYHTITTDDLYRFMRGEIVLPQKSLLLTFDDGRKDTYYNGDPILKTVGFSSVMFVISHFSIDLDGTNYYLSKEELGQMQATGRWDIQAHTYNGHGFVPLDAAGNKGDFFGNKAWLPEENRLETDQEYAERVSTDMSTVKIQLENAFQKKVNSFAFPFGDTGQEVTNYADSNAVLLDHASSLYNLMFFQFGPGVRFSDNYFNPLNAGKDSFLVRRIDITPAWSGADIVRVLQNASAKSLPYSDTFAADNGWVVSWGGVKVASSTLVLKAENSDSGAATVLDGTENWKDYQVTATLNAEDQSGAYLYMRFQDDSNTAACNFGDGFIHVEETVAGKENVLGGTENPGIVIPKGDFKVTARVVGRRLECTLGNTTVASNYLGPALNQGGIGFKIWDHPGIGSDLTVKAVSATAIGTPSDKATGSVPVALK